MIAVGIGVSLHDLPSKGGYLGKIVVRLERVQIVEMTYERRIGFGYSGQFGADAAGEGNKLVRGRLGDRRTRDALDLRRSLQSLRDE